MKNRKSEEKCDVEGFYYVCAVEPIGTFVAISSDGSMANLYKREGNIYLDCDGGENEPERIYSNYLYWKPLPEDFKLWFERKRSIL